MRRNYTMSELICVEIIYVRIYCVKNHGHHLFKFIFKELNHHWWRSDPKNSRFWVWVGSLNPNPNPTMLDPEF